MNDITNARAPFYGHLFFGAVFPEYAAVFVQGEERFFGHYAVVEGVPSAKNTDMPGCFDGRDDFIFRPRLDKIGRLVTKVPGPISEEAPEHAPFQPDKASNGDDIEDDV